MQWLDWAEAVLHNRELSPFWAKTDVSFDDPNKSSIYHVHAFFKNHSTSAIERSVLRAISVHFWNNQKSSLHQRRRQMQMLRELAQPRIRPHNPLLMWRWRRGVKHSATVHGMQPQQIKQLLLQGPQPQSRNQLLLHLKQPIQSQPCPAMLRNHAKGTSMPQPHHQLQRTLPFALIVL